MTEFSRHYWGQRKPPGPTEKKPKRPISRQKLQRMDEDAIYNAVRDVWLSQNPKCCNCPNHAAVVHHIVCGTAGRRRSLLNSDTWLGVCSPECHSEVERMSIPEQIALKQRLVKETIERLRR